jgi:hypothetical protein
MTKSRQALLLTAVCGAFALSAGASQADPLGGKEPWNFQPQNRAGIAATIKAIEDGGNGSGGSGGGTTIVCGGTSGGSGDGSTGSAASSTANSTCVIVNGSTGTVIDVDQDSDGNQTSGAETKTSSKTGSGGSIDEVAAILGGPRQ